jgi:hypothetical protein
MTRKSRAVLVSMGMLLSCASAATAQVVVTAAASANVGTTPGFFDIDDAAKNVHPGLGLSLSFLTDGWIGIEGETVFTPSAFSGHDLVESSRLVMASGGLLITAPAHSRRLVRPYISFGAGVAQISSADGRSFFRAGLLCSHSHGKYRGMGVVRPTPGDQGQCSIRALPAQGRVGFARDLAAVDRARVAFLSPSLHPDSVLH